ncbi:hypothetical protein KCP73_25355 [Salmonella enterica subsp. enterica]|nr:hypothetical protein KCP73_25355 [Salmonella enterica subsp. enterica]
MLTIAAVSDDGAGESNRVMTWRYLRRWPDGTDDRTGAEGGFYQAKTHV